MIAGRQKADSNEHLHVVEEAHKDCKDLHCEGLIVFLHVD
jgi:hypothetical protein